MSQRSSTRVGMTVAMWLCLTGLHTEAPSFLAQTAHPHDLAATSFDSPLLQMAPAPSWVTPVGLDTYSEFNADTVLFDTQIRVEETGYTLFRRHAMRITPKMIDAKGGAALQFSVAPDRETLSLHGVVLWRQGVPHDAVAELELTTREGDHSGSGEPPVMIDGLLSGAEPGDILDWSASWDVQTPDWPGHFYHEFFTDWAVPSLHDRTRIMVDQSRPLSLRLRGNAAAPTVQQSNGWTEYVWERREVAPVAFVADAPSNAFVFSSASVSTAMEWSDVAEWGSHRYAPDTRFPPSWQNDIAEWKKRPLRERITWAIRRVQDDIPYDHDRRGLSTHIARTPIDTLAEGRGDCKDKALLLASLLTALNVDAVVALTDIDEGLALPHRAPSAFAFDHAIVRIQTRDGIRYIDPTQSLQGGVFPNIPQAAFAFALPLRPGADLEPIIAPDLTAPTLDVVETFALMGDQIELTTVTTRRGSAADAFRRSEAAIDASGRRQQYTEFYAEIYPQITAVSDISVADDRLANAITMTERYVIPTTGQDSFLPTAVPVRADALRWDVFALAKRGRQYALALPDRTHARHTLRFVGPNVGLQGVVPLQYQGKNLAFSRDTQVRPGEVLIQYDLKSLGPAMSAREYAQANGLLMAFQASLVTTVNITPGPARLAQVELTPLASP